MSARSLRKEGSKEAGGRGELRREPSVVFHSPNSPTSLSPSTSPRQEQDSNYNGNSNTSNDNASNNSSNNNNNNNNINNNNMNGASSPKTGTLRPKLPSRSVNDVDLMVWSFSSSAPISEQSDCSKQSTPMGLIGLVEDETVQLLFNDNQKRIDNVALRQNSVIEKRPPEGPIAPSFVNNRGPESDRVAELESTIVRLEATVAKLQREKDDLLKTVYSLRSGKATCMVCQVGQAEVYFEGCGHLTLCALCDIHVIVCPLCNRRKPEK